MNRLDDVFGNHGWQCRFEFGPSVKKESWTYSDRKRGEVRVQTDQSTILCGVGVYVADQWLWKWDGAEMTDIEASKGGISSAMKRAVVHFGIGRYLYNLKATGAIIHPFGRYSTFLGSDEIRWSPPPLPKFALPDGITTLEETLLLIKDLYSAIPPDLVLEIADEERPVKEFLTQHRDFVKQDYYLALDILNAVRNAI